MSITATAMASRLDEIAEQHHQHRAGNTVLMTACTTKNGAAHRYMSWTGGSYVRLDQSLLRVNIEIGCLLFIYFFLFPPLNI
jgi:hypothetical protein